MNDKSKRRSRGGGREARRELRSSQAQNVSNKPYIKRNIPIFTSFSLEDYSICFRNFLFV